MDYGWLDVGKRLINSHYDDETGMKYMRESVKASFG